MNPTKYEYRSEFAKRYYGQGLAEGRAEGRAELILKLVTLRFGELPETARTAIKTAGVEELDRIGERLLIAASVEEVLGKP